MTALSPDAARDGRLPDIAVLGRLSRAVLSIATVASLIALALMIYEGASRYLVDVSYDWVEEVVRYLLVWAFFATLGIAGLRHCHIRTEMLVARMPAPLQRLTWVFACIVGLAYATLLGYSSVAQLQRYWVTRMVSESTLELPMWAIFMALPLGAVMLAVYYLIALRYALRGQDPFTPESIDTDTEVPPL
jgi:C4-dicarboxylate transporter DctQ subunit